MSFFLFLSSNSSFHEIADFKMAGRKRKFPKGYIIPLPLTDDDNTDDEDAEPSEARIQHNGREQQVAEPLHNEDGRHDGREEHGVNNDEGNDVDTIPRRQNTILHPERCIQPYDGNQWDEEQQSEPDYDREEIQDDFMDTNSSGDSNFENGPNEVDNVRERGDLNIVDHEPIEDGDEDIFFERGKNLFIFLITRLFPSVAKKKEKKKFKKKKLNKQCN